MLNQDPSPPSLRTSASSAVTRWGSPLRANRMQDRHAQSPEQDRRFVPFRATESPRRSPARSCIARHAAVDHEFRACHVAGRIGSEDECSVRYALRLPGPAKRHSGLGDFVPVDWLVAACARRYLRPNRRVDDAGMNRGSIPSPSATHSIATRSRSGQNYAMQNSGVLAAGRG